MEKELKETVESHVHIKDKFKELIEQLENSINALKKESN